MLGTCDSHKRSNERVQETGILHALGVLQTLINSWCMLSIDDYYRVMPVCVGFCVSNEHS